MPAAVTYSFAASTLAVASEVNTNFSDLVTYINNNVILKDASVAFTNVPSGPATDPSADNHLVRKEYVDGMGVIAQQTLTVDSPAYAANSLTDFVLNNVPVKAFYMYAIHIHTMCNLNAAVGDWGLVLRINGVDYSRMAYVQNRDAVSENRMLDATVFWTAPATAATDDFTVFADEIAGSTTLVLQGSATVKRTFTIYSLGPIIK